MDAGVLVARQLHRQSILDLVAEHEGPVLPSARLVRPETVSTSRMPRGGTASVVVVDTAWNAAEARTMVETLQATWPLRLRASGHCVDTESLRVAAWNDLAWRGIQLRGVRSSSAVPQFALRAMTMFLDVEPVYPDEWLDVALRQLAKAPVVPVISRLNHKHLLGVVADADVGLAYGHGDAHHT